MKKTFTNFCAFPERASMIKKLEGALDPMMDDFDYARKDIARMDDETLFNACMKMQEIDEEGTDYNVAFYAANGEAQHFSMT